MKVTCYAKASYLVC